MTKLLIDTDIGDDIDDALAIAAAMKLPEAELIGVTTVFKNTVLRARLARKLLRLGDHRHVPVYAGYGHGVRTESDVQEVFCQYSADLDEDASLRAEDGRDGKPEHAVTFILDCVRRYGDELTIVAIGPLTNIAKAIERDRDLMSKAGRIVLMGGAFYEHFREWNILCDPEAAEIVLHSGIDIACIGADVTWKCQLSQKQFEWILSRPSDGLEGFLSELVRLWSKSYHYAPVLHDPLAVWFAVYKRFVELEPALIAVETEGKHCRGMTLNLDHCFKYLPRPLDGFRISVAKSADVDGFLDQFMTTLFQYKTTIEEEGERYEIV